MASGINPSCELAAAYSFYGTPYYMYLAQAAGLEAVRRVICMLSTVGFKLAGKIKGQDDLGTTPFVVDETLDVEPYPKRPRKDVVAMWLFNLFLGASILYDLVEYLPYLSDSPRGNPLNSWQRMVRFALWFANSHIPRNALFSVMVWYLHAKRCDGIIPTEQHSMLESFVKLRDWFGNLNFGVLPPAYGVPLSQFVFATPLSRIAALAVVVGTIFFSIINILFGTPGLIYIWFGMLWCLCGGVLYLILNAVNNAFPLIDHFAPTHVIITAVFWAYTCTLVEMMASFYRRKAYIGAINESFYCRDNYDIWKMAIPDSVWTRVFF